MINDVFVIDGVGHAMDFSDANVVDGIPTEKIEGFRAFGYSVFIEQVESKEPGYRLTPEEWISHITAEDLAHAFFVESDVDMVVGHAVEIKPLFKNGMFRWDVLLDLREIAPERVLLYAAVDTFNTARPEIFERMSSAREQGAIGFKFYPSNGMFDRQSNKLISQFYDDPENAYPLFEKAQELGVKTVAFHKAQPVGVGPNTVVGVQDISTAAAEFPDLTFEVVHAGWAFLEDTAYQLQYHPNIYANLENTLGLAVNQPRRFAHILGTLLRAGVEDRLIYGSGCALNHPDPQIRAFMDFQMPEELMEGYGYPAVTDDVKRKMLGGNIARMHGVDIEARKRAIEGDAWSTLRAKGKTAPWSGLRARLSGAKGTT
ncbi:MAG: amidohydrolase family protein [Chloroflexota bacterium]|nr:amidohydrolase family protein [Chloroflexota bacterium]